MTLRNGTSIPQIGFGTLNVPPDRTPTPENTAITAEVVALHAALREGKFAKHYLSLVHGNWREPLRRVRGLKRMFLHACVLEFPHPATGAMLRVESELPAELQAFYRPARKTVKSERSAVCACVAQQLVDFTPL